MWSTSVACQTYTAQGGGHQRAANRADATTGGRGGWVGGLVGAGGEEGLCGG